jgi:hypothetical protein
MEGAFAPDDRVYFQFTVENNSELPCYYTYFEVFDEDAIRYFRLGTLTVPQGDGLTLGSRFESTRDPQKRAWPYFRVTFMDASGVFWERDSYGSLRKTSDSKDLREKPKKDETLAERRAREVMFSSKNSPLRNSRVRVKGPLPQAGCGEYGID